MFFFVSIPTCEVKGKRLERNRLEEPKKEKREKTRQNREERVANG